MNEKIKAEIDGIRDLLMNEGARLFNESYHRLLMVGAAVDTRLGVIAEFGDISVEQSVAELEFLVKDCQEVETQVSLISAAIMEYVMRSRNAEMCLQRIEKAMNEQLLLATEKRKLLTK